LYESSSSLSRESVYKAYSTTLCLPFEYSSVATVLLLL